MISQGKHVDYSGQVRGDSQGSSELPGRATERLENAYLKVNISP
jgi:hypothetical protein